MVDIYPRAVAKPLPLRHGYERKVRRSRNRGPCARRAGALTHPERPHRRLALRTRPDALAEPSASQLVNRARVSRRNRLLSELDRVAVGGDARRVGSWAV